MTQPTQTQNDGAPLYLFSLGRSYNQGWCGAAGVVEGLRAVHHDWKPVTFIVADHHTKGDTIYRRTTVAIAAMNPSGELFDEQPRWRYCGENDEPLGASSSTICNYERENFELTIAIVMNDLARIRGKHPNACIYRVRLDTDL